MKVTLAHRHYGIHRQVAETEIPGDFSDYATPDPQGRRDDYLIDEDKLIAALPDGFLRVPAPRTLLAVSDDLGGTGQRDLKRFKDWAKYFDADCLNLVKAPGGEA